MKVRIFYCTNGDDCPYGNDRRPEQAYSQHETSWLAGKPRWHGLCLNCIDDYNRDEEVREVQS